MQNISQNHDPIAIRLAVAIKRLRARLREVADATGLPIAQISILRRLRLEGSTTAAALAAAEHVSHQAVAQNLSALQRAGLIHTTPDPTDGRKRMIEMTEAGDTLFDSIVASRNAWLVQAIEKAISAEELPALEKAIELLERLADAGH